MLAHAFANIKTDVGQVFICELSFIETVNGSELQETHSDAPSPKETCSLQSVRFFGYRYHQLAFFTAQILTWSVVTMPSPGRGRGKPHYRPRGLSIFVEDL